jgi:uncharacterized membrane protein YphA (DoxX/SURF4 family)
MKILVNFSRIIVGLLFIFSGFIKSNDPKGFSYKLQEYFDVFAQDLRSEQDSFKITIWEDELNYFETTEPLYSFSAEKQIILNTGHGGILDINDSTQYVGVDVHIIQDNSPAGNITVLLRDSFSEAPVQLIAFVGDKEVLNKEIQLSVAGFGDIIESADVSGYIKPDTFLVGWLGAMQSKSVFLSIFICVLEIVLGIAILIGWKPNLVSWLLLLTIIFFTFLTWYSATYDKVTDCGCFGDAIKLTPWQSFYKDAILFVLILIIWLGKSRINLFFSKGLTTKIVAITLILSTGYGLYCNAYLPMIDFLNFAEGEDVLENMSCPEGSRTEDLKEIYYIYEKDGLEVTIVFNTGTNAFTPAIPEGAKYVRVDGEKILEEACKPPIHDFVNIHNSFDGDVSEKMVSHESYQLWIVSVHTESANSNAWSKIKDLTSPWVHKDKLPVYAMTSSSLEDAESLAVEEGLPFHFFNADNTLLKSMIRSSPGIMLLNGTTVVKRWSSRNVPSYSEVKKLME